MKKIFTIAAALMTSVSLMAADVIIALSAMSSEGNTYTWEGTEVKAKNNPVLVEMPGEEVMGTITFYGSSDKSDRFEYIYKDAGTVKDEERKAVMAAAGASIEFSASDIIIVNEKPYLKFLTADDFKFKKLSFTAESAKVDPTKATVKNITINGENLAGFAADQLTYNVELPYGTTEIPVVAAEAGNEASIEVTQATALPGAAKVVCTSKDGTSEVKTYTINFTVATTASTDATLKSLSVNGTALEGFAADKYTYNYELAYSAALPVVTAETNDAAANAVITDVTEIPGTATVVVTAQDGTTKLTYSVAFTRAAAIKKINEVIMSNSYSAYIPEGQAEDALKIYAFYLAGEDAPTVKSYLVNEGTTWSQNDNIITLTGADESTVNYTLVVEAVIPLTFTADEIIFDGSESWIKGGYGWDETKKWKFSKTDNDYSREIAGKTHLEFFLPACDSIDLYEAGVNNRDIRVYINGVQFGDKVNLVKNKKLGLKVAQNAPFMLTIASAQTGGDGGIKGIQLFKSGATAIENTDAAVKAVKVVRDGQMMILKNGVLYNMQGAVVK